MYTRLSSAIAITKKAAKRRLGGRQVVALSAFAGLHASLFTVVNILRLADYGFSPKFRKEPLRAPVFIVATPRSGTTFLHHLLALDEKNFSHLKLYQTVLPSVTAERMIQSVDKVDSFIGAPLRKCLSKFNQRLFSQWDGIHEVGLGREEEDEALFMLGLMSPALYLVFPYLSELPEFSDIDRHLDLKSLERLKRDYHLTLRRHLYVHGLNNEGNARTPLIKNVLLPSRLSTVTAAFPDAKFLRLKRNPAQAIPSALSLFYETWRKHSPEIQRNSKEVSELADMFIQHFKKLDLFCAENPNAHTLEFENLISNPLHEIRKAYAFLELELTKEVEEKMRSSIARPQEHKSIHRYDLESFGLNEKEIFEALPDERRAVAAQKYDQGAQNEE